MYKKVLAISALITFISVGTVFAENELAENLDGSKKLEQGAKQLGKDVEKEAGKAEQGARTEAEKAKQGAKQLGKDVEKEAGKAEQGARTEAEKAKQGIQKEMERYKEKK